MRDRGKTLSFGYAIAFLFRCTKRPAKSFLCDRVGSDGRGRSAGTSKGVFCWIYGAAEAASLQDKIQKTRFFRSLLGLPGLLAGAY
jgi:hypothetical protein